MFIVKAQGPAILGCRASQEEAAIFACKGVLMFFGLRT